MKVSIIGPKDAGKTTILGLLYETMRACSNKNPKNLRFYKGEESLKTLNKLHLSLLTGNNWENTKRCVRKNDISLLLELGVGRKKNDRISNFIRRWAKSSHLRRIDIEVKDVKLDEVISIYEQGLEGKEGDIIIIVLDTTQMKKRLVEKVLDTTFQDEKTTIIIFSRIDLVPQKYIESLRQELGRNKNISEINKYQKTRGRSIYYFFSYFGRGSISYNEEYTPCSRLSYPQMDYQMLCEIITDQKTKAQLSSLHKGRLKEKKTKTLTQVRHN